MQVNGRAIATSVAPDSTLLQLLREQLGLTGAKESCSRGECGACTVLEGDTAVYSCVRLAVDVREPITTIEGLSPTTCELRRAFATAGGLQCGFCTPGMLMRAATLAHEPESRDEAGVRRALTGNICRCTGYDQIVRALTDHGSPR